MNKNLVNKIDIPVYVLNLLKAKGNALIGREYVVKYGKDQLIETLKSEGYDVVLNIITDSKSNIMYPKEATYILEERR